MDEREIPDIVVGRLPLYLRALHRMEKDGRQVTSSQELGEFLGVSAAQIRKDLSQFGEFGKQGTGYPIPFLINKLRQILNVNRDWDLAVVGAGDIGSAVARYKGLSDRGFRVVMIFDSDPAKVGHMIDNFTIQDSAVLVNKIRAAGLQVAMITVPASEAQKVADQLVEAGVKAILNYAPVTLNVPPGVHV